MTATPEVIASYFEASARNDVDTLVECFTEDAWVVDENRRHEGRDAIRAWREGTASAFTYTLELRGVTETGPQEFAAETHLEGDFPGGVVDLQHTFGLRDGRIARLHI
jgi:ketosteroid isomerase-like protein